MSNRSIISLAMFSMFVVTTQDGWVNMVNELRVGFLVPLKQTNQQSHGHFIEAAMFFCSFVVAGDFMLVQVCFFIAEKFEN
jgi:hypothetical protein